VYLYYALVFILKSPFSGRGGTFVGMVLLTLYENEVEGLGSGHRRRGGAVVATAPSWAMVRPLQMAQC
jgi:hypothetical protein